MFSKRIYLSVVGDHGLGRGRLGRVLHLLGRAGHGGRERLVLGGAEQVRQGGGDLDVEREVHAEGDEAGGEQAGDFVGARERGARVAAEALLLGPAAELERDAVAMSLGDQAQQVLVGARLVQEDGLARSGAAFDAAAKAAREAADAFRVLQVARVDGAALSTAWVHVFRLGSVEVGVGGLGHVRHRHVAFQGWQLHDQLDAAALAVAVQRRSEVDQLEHVITADQADLVVAGDWLAGIGGALEAADLASGFEA